VDPIEIRYKDDEERTQAIQNLSKFISDIRKFADSVSPQEKEQVR